MKEGQLDWLQLA